MRLWTVHPCHLDARGLVALWREGLLAQKVLAGQTRGYRHHPQLTRFRAQPDPASAIAAYLDCVQQEATVRGYRFDVAKLGACRGRPRIIETEGQLRYEWQHLLTKLRARDAAAHARCEALAAPRAHPLFEIVAGDIQPWEIRTKEVKNGT